MSTLKTYRGFQYFPFGKQEGEPGAGASVFVKNSLQHPSLNPHLPRRFHWTAVDDEKGLRFYIDALIERDRPTCAYYETEHYVINIVYPDKQSESVIKISPVLLLAIVRGEYPLYMGQCNNVTVRSYHNRYFVTHFPLALADEKLLPEYYQALNDRIQNGKHIIVDKNLKTEGKVGDSSRYHPEWKRADINLVTADQQLQAPEYNGTFTYPIESFVEQHLFKDRLEVITHVLLEDQTYYYCKRHFDHDCTVFKMETSWDGIEWKTVEERAA